MAQSGFQKTLVRVPLDKQGTFVALTVLFTVITMVAVVTAFWTASWLVIEDSPGVIPRPILPFRLPFHKLGLWDICVRAYQFNNKFNPYTVICELMVKLSDFNTSIPGFVFATEILYTFGLIFSGLASIMVIVTVTCGENIHVLRTIGSFFLISGILACIAVIVFAAYNTEGAAKDNSTFLWEEHRELGWSFWVAVSGSVGLLVCGVCYFVESRLFAERLRNRSLVTKIVC